MAQPYIGEIRMFAGNFAPAGWQFCDGQLVPISENDALFTLIGTTYGGDGETTFALPDLRGRLPLHMGQGPSLSNYVIGESGGVESVTLTTQQIPAHSHAFQAAAAAGSTTNAQGNVIADSPIALYIEAAANSPFAPTAIVSTGGSQPHDNLMPYLGINYIISMFGIFPSQN